MLNGPQGRRPRPVVSGSGKGVARDTHMYTMDPTGGNPSNDEAHIKRSSNVILRSHSEVPSKGSVTMACNFLSNSSRSSKDF